MQQSLVNDQYFGRAAYSSNPNSLHTFMEMPIVELLDTSLSLPYTLTMYWCCWLAIPPSLFINGMWCSI